MNAVIELGRHLFEIADQCAEEIIQKAEIKDVPFFVDDTTQQMAFSDIINGCPVRLEYVGIGLDLASEYRLEIILQDWDGH